MGFIATDKQTKPKPCVQFPPWSLFSIH